MEQMAVSDAPVDLAVTSSREAILRGIVVPVKPIQPVLFATLAFEIRITKATKSTSTAPRLVDAVIAGITKLGRLKDVAQRIGR